MSAKLTGQVWELDLPHAQLLVLLSLADHGKDDGSDVYPSVGKTAWKAGYSVKQVQRIMDQLIEAKILVLVEDRSESGESNKYRIDISAAPRKAEYVGKRKRKRAGERGQNVAPLNPEDRAVNTTGSGSEIAPPGPVENVAPGATPECRTGGDTAMSPEPSVNRQVTVSVKTGASAGVENSNGRRNGKPKLIRDALNAAAGLHSLTDDDLHLARSEVIGELKRVAWLALDPPTIYSDRAAEASIVTQLLEYSTAAEVKGAIGGIRLILGPGVPFTAKLLLSGRLFRAGQDAVRSQISKSALPLFRRLLREALISATQTLEEA